MKKIEELLEDIIESSKVAALRFPRNGIEAQKVLTIKAEILRLFAELENYKYLVDNTPFGHWKGFLMGFFTLAVWNMIMRWVTV